MASLVPVYSLRQERKTIELVEVGKGERLYKSSRPVTAAQLFDREQTARSEERHRGADFLRAIQLILAGELVIRPTIRKLLTTGSRNIRIDPPTILDCHRHGETNREADASNRSRMKMQEVQTSLRNWLTPLRIKLGLPDDNDPCRYMLSERLIAEVSSPACRQIIEQQHARYGDFIGSSEKEQLVKTLTFEMQREPDPVIAKAIESTIKKINLSKTREHLSAITLSTAGGELTTVYVGLANPQGEALTLEGWKFVKLLEEHDSALCVGDPPPQPAGSEPSLFAFHGKSSPRDKDRELFRFVYARLHTSTATLEVVRTDHGGKEVRARANFVIDLDYALTLSLTLNYLREDRERHARLKERADLKSNLCADFVNKLFFHHQP